MQAIIALTVGEIVDFESRKPWTPVMYGQFRTYVDAVVRAGGAPFVVPLVDDETILRQLYERCDGLLLTGGHDLEPSLYKAAPRPGGRFHISPRRDKQESRLLTWALEDDKPVLGICRGMQLINAVLGGKLHQDIADDVPAASNHTLSADKRDFQQVAHRLAITPDSKLAQILGTTQVAANTLHHQAVAGLGKGLIATAYAEDGIIEAIELPGKRFVIGVQSHPEALEGQVEQVWRKLFAAFIKSAAAPR